MYLGGIEKTGSMKWANPFVLRKMSISYFSLHFLKTFKMLQRVHCNVSKIVMQASKVVRLSLQEY